MPKERTIPINMRIQSVALSTKQTKEEAPITLSKLALEYADNDKARELFEAMRWPRGIECPHCKSEGYYTLNPRKDSKSPSRKGLYKCKTCWRQFTVTVGTILEDTKIPLGKWLMAIFIIGSSKKAEIGRAHV